MVSQAVRGLGSCPAEERRTLRRRAQSLLQQEVRFIDSDEFRSISLDDSRLAALASARRARPLTLLELSGELGICKERVRQVEHVAIEKLRIVALQLMNTPMESSEVLSA